MKREKGERKERFQLEGRSRRIWIIDKKLDSENLSSDTTVEDIMVVMFTLPFSVLANKIMHENYKDLLTEKLARRVAHMCFQALT